MNNYTLIIVAIGGTILGAISGAIGCFTVLRKQSLIGDVISHATLPGICIAFILVGRTLPGLLLGAGIASLLALGLMNLIQKFTRIKEDIAMGIALSGWFAIGLGLLTFIQKQENASQAGINNLIFGQAAAIILSDLLILVTVSGLIITVLLLNWKEFKLITFDPNFAKSLGMRVDLLSFLLNLLTIITVVIGLQLAGVVLMVGLIIAPAVAARQWVQHLSSMLVVSAIIGAFSGAVGAIISSIDANIPTGPMIIVFACTFVIISLFFAPRRGLIWNKFAQEHIRSHYVKP